MVNVNDRIEEYRRDWQAGPGGPSVKKKRRLPRASRRIKLSGLVMLLVCGLLVSSNQLVELWRHRLARKTQDELNRVKTELEISAHLRLLRQYYLSNDALPQDPLGYLKPFFKDNKPFPKGCDFWGNSYRVDSDVEQFGIRSAGADGRMDTRDDLYAGLRFKDISSAAKP